jgi:hypothetical protein
LGKAEVEERPVSDAHRQPARLAHELDRSGPARGVVLIFAAPAGPSVHSARLLQLAPDGLTVAPVRI